MNKIFIKLLLVTLSGTCLLHSCATILSGTKQRVEVTTEPAGAKVFVDGMERGLTPCVIDVKRSSKVIYTFRKEGYDDGSVLDIGAFNGVVIANVLIGGIIGIAVDFGTGAAYKLGKQILYIFPQNATYTNDPAIMENEENNQSVD